MPQEKIFISYSRKDTDIVHPLAKEIEAETGLKCWIDLNGIESGDEFEEKIIGAIDRVPVVIFMLSDNSMHSDYAKKEIRYAQNCEKKIVPVVIDGGKLRGWFLFSFGGVDYIDISNPDQKEKLFKNLRSWFDMSEESSPSIPQAENNEETNTDLESKIEEEYEQAHKLFGCGKYDEGFAHLKFVADQGNANAQYNIGVCYENGRGVHQSYAEAVKWYKRAANKGDDCAQKALALCYEYGYGVPQSYEEAVKWFKMAADQGLAAAQYNLGVCYEKGYGVPQSYEEAVKLYSLAADQGDANAQCYLGYSYFNGQGIPRSNTEAVKWFNLAAEQGNASAQYALGWCYKNGHGTQKSEEQAIHWLKKSAAQGVEEARKELKSMGC